MSSLFYWKLISYLNAKVQVRVLAFLTSAPVAFDQLKLTLRQLLLIHRHWEMYKLWKVKNKINKNTIFIIFS